MVPLAPGRLSTMTGWPNASLSLGAIWRTRTSGALPAIVGTMMWIGLFGKLCACARPQDREIAKSVAMRLAVMTNSLSDASFHGNAAQSRSRGRACDQTFSLGVFDELAYIGHTCVAALRNRHRQMF